MVFQVGGNKYHYLFNVLYRRADDAGGRRSLLLAKLVSSCLERSNLAPGYYADRDARLGASIINEGIQVITQSRFTICLCCPNYLDERLPMLLQEIGLLQKGTRFLPLACGVSRQSLLAQCPYFLNHEILCLKEPYSKNINNWQGKLCAAIREDLRELYTIKPEEIDPLELPWPAPSLPTLDWIEDTGTCPCYTEEESDAGSDDGTVLAEEGCDQPIHDLQRNNEDPPRDILTSVEAAYSMDFTLSIQGQSVPGCGGCGPQGLLDHAIDGEDATALLNSFIALGSSAHEAGTDTHSSNPGGHGDSTSVDKQSEAAPHSTPPSTQATRASTAGIQNEVIPETYSSMGTTKDALVPSNTRFVPNGKDISYNGQVHTTLLQANFLQMRRAPLPQVIRQTQERQSGSNEVKKGPELGNTQGDPCHRSNKTAGLEAVQGMQTDLREVIALGKSVSLRVASLVVPQCILPKI